MSEIDILKEITAIRREIDILKCFEIPSAGSTDKAYGSMYGDDIAVSVVIASSGIYYPLTSGLLGGNEHNMIFQNAREIKVVEAGDYKIDWSMTIKVSAGANSHIEGGVMINSTSSQRSVNATHIQNSGDEQSVSGTCILTLAVNDLIKLCVENETDTNDVIVDHANLSVVKVN